VEGSAIRAGSHPRMVVFMLISGQLGQIKSDYLKCICCVLCSKCIDPLESMYRGSQLAALAGQG